MAIARDNQYRNSILGIATIAAATWMYIFAFQDDNTIQNDHQLRAFDPKTVAHRTLIHETGAATTGEEACAPHVMFSTFRCTEEEESSACTPLRKRIEDNTYHIWSSFPTEVTFKVVDTSKLETNIHGVPLLRDMYLHAMAECPDSLTYTFINGDIIGTHDFIESINAALTLGKDFLMIGKRVNVWWDESYDVTADTDKFDWIDHVAKNGKLFVRYAEDYFTVTKNAIDWNAIPPFVIGRAGYDNWLVDYAYRKSNVVLVDATYSAQMVHQSEVSNRVHGGVDISDDDKLYNLNIIAEAGTTLDHPYTTDAEWQIRRPSGGGPLVPCHTRYWDYEAAKKSGYDSM